MEFNLQTIALLAVVLGQIVAIVVAIRKPNEDQNVVIAELKTNVFTLSDSMKLVKDNHLPHIENDVKDINSRLTRIETILEERLPAHKN